MNVIKIVQYSSPIRHNKRQRLILKGLGLGKINRIRLLEDTPSIRGMVKKISHIVKIIN